MCILLDPIRLMGNSTQNTRKSLNKSCILTHITRASVNVLTIFDSHNVLSKVTGARPFVLVATHLVFYEPCI